MTLNYTAAAYASLTAATVAIGKSEGKLTQAVTVAFACATLVNPAWPMSSKDNSSNAPATILDLVKDVIDKARAPKPATRDIVTEPGTVKVTSVKVTQAVTLPPIPSLGQAMTASAAMFADPTIRAALVERIGDPASYADPAQFLAAVTKFCAGYNARTEKKRIDLEAKAAKAAAMAAVTVEDEPEGGINSDPAAHDAPDPMALAAITIGEALAFLQARALSGSAVARQSILDAMVAANAALDALDAANEGERLAA